MYTAQKNDKNGLFKSDWLAGTQSKSHCVKVY